MPYDGGGNTLKDRQVTWESSDSSIASVERGGKRTATVTGKATGEVEITATSEG
ncbi:MAG: Ig-like domain-containing protein, partial [Bradymonadaceae bacterium]